MEGLGGRNAYQKWGLVGEFEPAAEGLEAGFAVGVREGRLEGFAQGL